MEYRLMDENTAVSLLGFGAMRLPLNEDGSIDREQGKRMVASACQGGINYFDTAYGYHNGESELFLAEALADYPRESYYLADKMPMWYVKEEADTAKIFDDQLAKCGVDYFDFYLLHAVNQNYYDQALKYGVIDFLLARKEQGLIKHLGFSFHDDYELFATVLTAHPWDFCQIQFNYMDVDYQAGLRGLTLAGELKIPVIVMEPLKGGKLAHLPEDIRSVLTQVKPDATPVEWAFRFVASHPQVKLILSGMSDEKHVEQNTQLFARLSPLTETEADALQAARKLFLRRQRNACTTCGYCMPCPFGVDIPDNFSYWNEYAQYGVLPETVKAYWRKDFADKRANACQACGQCESVCPQNLRIIDDLARLDREFREIATANGLSQNG